MITQNQIKSLFEYKDGDLYWKEKSSPKSRIKIGDKITSKFIDGYHRVCINRKTYKLHRIIFLYHFGYLPEIVDHIDCNKNNNRIENLRQANKSQSQHNKGLQKNNKSGIKGVNWCNNKMKWRSRCQINGKRISKYFTDLNEAEEYVVKLRNILHNEYANNGKME